MQLTTEDAAQLADVRQITIRQNILRGNLQAEKRGRDWAIEWDEFERWATARGVQLSPEIEFVRRKDGSGFFIVRGALSLAIARAAERAGMSFQEWAVATMRRVLEDVSD